MPQAGSGAVVDSARSLYAADMSARLVVLTLATLGAAPAAQAPAAADVRVAGGVVDTRGRAVEGAMLGTGWWFDRSRTSAYGSQDVWPVGAAREANGWQPVRTDAAGRFDARVLPQRGSGKVQLVVFSADLRLGGAFAWDPRDDLRALRLVLEPVARFRATLTCDALGRREVPATAYLRSYDGRRLGRFKADAGLVDLRLPPGHFVLHVYGAEGQDVESRDFPFAVAAGRTRGPGTSTWRRAGSPRTAAGGSRGGARPRRAASTCRPPTTTPSVASGCSCRCGTARASSPAATCRS